MADSRCGSINSPTLLQRSGVGPADLLGSMNIPVVSELPVGFNFQEHVAFAMFFDTVYEGGSVGLTLVPALTLGTTLLLTLLLPRLHWPSGGRTALAHGPMSTRLLAVCGPSHPH